MTILNIAYFEIFGKPVLFYTGILTFLIFLTVAFIGYQTLRGHSKIRYHRAAVIIAFSIATIHAILGLSAYFNF